MIPRCVGVAAGTVLLSLLPASALPTSAGEASPHEEALKAMLKSLDRMTTAVGGVKDAETADAARPDLKKAVDGWTMARAKADKLPPPEPAEKERLTKQYKGKMDAALKKLLTEVGRVNAVPAAKGLLKELRVVLEPAAPAP